MLAFYGSYGPDFLADVRLSKLISARLLFVPDEDDDEIGTSSARRVPPSIISDFALFGINDRAKIRVI